MIRQAPLHIASESSPLNNLNITRQALNKSLRVLFE